MPVDPFNPSSWEDSLPLANPSEIEAFEHKHGIKVPDQYKTFLCTIANGGRATFENEFLIPGEVGGDEVESLNGFRNGYLSLTETYEEGYYDILIKNALPIGNDGLGNFMLLSVDPSNHGQVFFFDHEESDLYAANPFLRRIGGDFNSFLTNLIQSDETSQT